MPDSTPDVFEGTDIPALALGTKTVEIIFLVVVVTHTNGGNAQDRDIVVGSPIIVAFIYKAGFIVQSTAKSALAVCADAITIEGLIQEILGDIALNLDFFKDGSGCQNSTPLSLFSLYSCSI